MGAGGARPAPVDLASDPAACAHAPHLRDASERTGVAQHPAPGLPKVRGVVQNAFFLLAGASIGVGLVVVQPGLFSLQLGSLPGHAALAFATATTIALVAWVVLRRFRDTWADAREGA